MVLDWETIKNLVLYAGLDGDTFRKLYPEFHKYNRKMLLRGIILVWIFCMGAVYLSSSVGYFMEVKKVAYIFTAYFSAVVLTVLWLAESKYPKILVTLLYIFESIVGGCAIFIGTVILPTEPSVGFIAVILILPQLFIDSPIRSIILIIAFSISFVTAAYLFKTTFLSDLLNVIANAFFSILLNILLSQLKASNIYALKCLERYEQDLVLVETQLIERLQRDVSNAEVNPPLVKYYAELKGIFDFYVNGEVVFLVGLNLKNSLPI